MRCIFTIRTIGMTSVSIGTNHNGLLVWRIVSVCIYIGHVCHWRAMRQIQQSCFKLLCNRTWDKMASSWEKSRENGPATIRQAQIAVSEVLGRLHFNTATFHGCYEVRATGHHLQNRWKTDLVARRVLRWRKPEESAIFQWSNKL